jgi:hypothetical protein
VRKRVTEALAGPQRFHVEERLAVIPFPLQFTQRRPDAEPADVQLASYQPFAYPVDVVTPPLPRLEPKVAVHGCGLEADVPEQFVLDTKIGPPLDNGNTWCYSTVVDVL